ncbi:hypothetical protein L202_00557 [Cryptococcus amylolentus CBS 6039]|uniref:Uncharacterized protein n=2 Tax=Cryptococcus amylolentus TaxID=104669 RepID=A0A1E3I7T4_9TREE|nr:hypothetical protein L202_00557 [Cryptococcus amylolentus CBS 6039]ODN84654.1 hypothetical protein L202_00557 [Cryptococcus amylolentus CBS 6039]ODO11590.1 hypothetical protein I350_00372 [Cryptococcus amylolentus CBS 6273]
MDIDVDRWSEDERMEEEAPSGEWTGETHEGDDGDETMGEDGAVVVEEEVFEEEIDMDVPTPKPDAFQAGPGEMDVVAPAPDGEVVHGDSHTPELEMRPASPAPAAEGSLPPPLTHELEMRAASPAPDASVVVPTAQSYENEDVDPVIETEAQDEGDDPLSSGLPEGEGDDRVVDAQPPLESESTAHDAAMPPSTKETVPASGSPGHPKERHANDNGDGNEEEDEYDEGDEEEPITADNLPSILLHLPPLASSPTGPAVRALFSPIESDPGQVAVWLKDRQLELAEASLYDVWAAIRAECAKEGLIQGAGDGMIITEKAMDLKMAEDDVNIQSITFLEFVILYHGCELAEPVQLYLTWEPSRFITRFNAIQSELEMMRSKSDSSAIGSGDEYEEGEEVYEEGTEYEENREYHHEETGPQEGEEGQEASPANPKADDKAQYADSTPGDDPKALERAHPNWADARAQPTEELYYKGTDHERQVVYPAPKRVAEGSTSPKSPPKEIAEAGADDEHYDEATAENEEYDEDAAGEAGEGWAEEEETDHQEPAAQMEPETTVESSEKTLLTAEEPSVLLDSINPTREDTVPKDEIALLRPEHDRVLRQETPLVSGISTPLVSLPPSTPDATVPLPSGINTPAEDSSLTPSEVDQAKAKARDISAPAKASAIPEESEVGVDEAEKLVNEEIKSTEPLPDGESGFVPPEVSTDDVIDLTAEDDYEDEEYNEDDVYEEETEEGYEQGEEGEYAEEEGYATNEETLDDDEERTAPEEDTGAAAGDEATTLSKRSHDDDEDGESKRAKRE